MNRDNGLIYKTNPKIAPGAKESVKMDFQHADRVDPVKLNVILWEDAMGGKPVPQMRFAQNDEGIPRRRMMTEAE